MAKLVVIPDSITNLDRLLINADAILFGIEGLSVNCVDISPSELSPIVAQIKSLDKEVFISLNKNMHNQDLLQLEELLVECESLKVDGVFYADVAVLQICHRLSLDLPIIWSAEHLVTNFHTIRYWEKFNIAGAFLSNELTLEEILDIRENISLPLIVQGFGYLPMYVSKRMAINNYLTHFKLNTSSQSFSLWKEGYEYPILERSIGTEIYSGYVLNAIYEYLIYKENKIDYVLLSGFKIDRDSFLRVIEMFKTADESNKEEYKKEIDGMFNNTSQGFLHTEAIYQVKKNEK